MTRAERRAVVGILLGVAIGAAVAAAGSQRGATVAGWPVFALCAALSFAINWLVFVPSFIQQTEHYFDLTGSLTYVTVVVTALVLSGTADARAWLLAALVVVWAGRLGSFLFARIRRDGRDGRFDALKPPLGDDAACIHTQGCAALAFWSGFTSQAWPPRTVLMAPRAGPSPAPLR